jgi:chromosome partitioning protein
MNDVRANLPGRVYETVIPRNVRLSEAPSHGRPAILYDIESKGAQSYLQLAEEMLHRHRTVSADLKLA